MESDERGRDLSLNQRKAEVEVPADPPPPQRIDLPKTMDDSIGNRKEEPAGPMGDCRHPQGSTGRRPPRAGRERREGKRRSRRRIPPRTLEALEAAQEDGDPILAKVVAVNKGGLELEIMGVRGFCPTSQIEDGFCDDPASYVGQEIEAKITDCSHEGRNLVVSRRALLHARKPQKAQPEIVEGAELQGRVSSLQSYGAFIDLGGVQGMVHVSQVGHQRTDHPKEVLAIGDEVRVKVLSVDPDPKRPDRQRIGLSIRALLADPWQEVFERLDEGDWIEGKVVGLRPFGAFVEIQPGVNGLVHISEIASDRVKHPSDVVSEGEVVTARVITLDRQTRRISLSMRPEGGEESTSKERRRRPGRPQRRGRDRGDEVRSPGGATAEEGDASLGTLGEMLTQAIKSEDP